MRKSNFALRLQPSLLEEARKVAEAEGVALNQFINVAVAEKLSALETEKFFRERASNSNRDAYMRFLDMAGSEAPVEGDLGVAEVERVGGSTVADATRYHSYRREQGRSGRHLSAIALV